MPHNEDQGAWEVRSDLLSGDRITVARTGAGGLIVTGVAARSGVVTYRDTDGREWREWTPPEVLEACRAQGVGLPVTLDHPPAPVTPETVGAYQRGTVLSVAPLVPDPVPLPGGGMRQRARMVVTHPDAQTPLLDGTTRELSWLYAARVDHVPGLTPDGTPYDTVQRARTLNSIALVARGRHGGRVDRSGALVEPDRSPSPGVTTADPPVSGGQPTADRTRPTGQTTGSPDGGTRVASCDEAAPEEHTGRYETGTGKGHANFGRNIGQTTGLVRPNNWSDQLVRPPARGGSPPPPGGHAAPPAPADFPAKISGFRGLAPLEVVDAREKSRTQSGGTRERRSDGVGDGEGYPMVMRRTLMVAALAAFPAAGWDQARADAELSLYEAELREAGATSARADAKDAEVAPVELRGDEEGFLVLAKEREGLLEVLRGESKEGEDVARFDSLGLPALRSAVLGGSSAPAGVDAEVWARVASAHRVSQYRASVASSQRADSVSQSLRSGKAPGAKAERRADGEDELKPLPLSNLARGGDTSREITR